MCPVAGVLLGDGRMGVIAPCLLGGLVLGAFAMVAGYLRWRQAGGTSGGVTFLGCVGLAIWMLACIVTVPGFIKATTLARKNACIQNLRQLEGAIEVWMRDKQKRPGDVAPDDGLFGEGRYPKEKPRCPAGGTYSYHVAGVRPTCSVPGHTL